MKCMCVNNNKKRWSRKAYLSESHELFSALSRIRSLIGCLFVLFIFSLFSVDLWLLDTPFGIFKPYLNWTIFFYPLYVVSFYDVWLMITMLVSSNFP
jgi:hypothetical protein